MFNEDKKLITEINRKKNMDENLAAFADVVLTADFEYACQKFCAQLCGYPGTCGR